MSRSRWVVSLVVSSWLLLGGCASPDDPERPGPGEGNDGLTVYAVNYPLAYFGERIGGDGVEVVLPVPAGEDPAFWSPAPEQVEAFQHADLIVLNGAGYAKWVERVTLPTSKLVDTTGGVRDRLIGIESTVTHTHGPEGDHSHGETAFTTWLDPTLAVDQAWSIAFELSTRWPASVEGWQERIAEIEQDLSVLDASLQQVFSERRDEPLLGSHPVYQYLARRYALNLESVHFEPHEFPDDAAWAELEASLARHPARWMLWEGEPMAETRTRLEELGVTSVVFDPCGNRPDEGDLLSVMQSNVENVRRAFGSN